jgi:hypothetical protein
MSYQGHWEEQVYQTELPLWTRVYALAMARSEPNLHTRIGEAELAVLGKARPDGTRNPVDRRRFWEAIQRLTDLGWLDPTSDRNCLVLSAAGHACERRGSKKRCDYHTGQLSTVKGDIAVVDREAEAFLERESYRGVGNVQASAVLRPLFADDSSAFLGRARLPAGQELDSSAFSGAHADREVVA